MPRIEPKASQSQAAAADTAVLETAPVSDDPMAAAAVASARQAQAVQRATRVAPTSLPGREHSTADHREPELADKVFPNEGLPERGDVQIAVADALTDKQYFEALQFNEQPVKIRIEPSQEENAPMTVDCWCNGKGAEVWDERTRTWMEWNFLPVGLPIITKRKYVEILARSKSMKVNTPNHGDLKNADNNTVTRKHIRGHVFSVLQDSPKGAEWLTAILSESF